MKKRLLIGLAVGMLVGAMVPAAASACPTCPEPPNQGRPDFVLMVDNEYVTCDCPMPGPKIEGDDLGHKVYVRAPHGYQLDKVTVKSGRDNEVWGWFWHYGTVGKVLSKKDISNYVVWYCPKDANGIPT